MKRLLFLLVFFIAVQFHPEFQSKPDKAHPLFREFIKAALEKQKAGKAILKSHPPVR